MFQLSRVCGTAVNAIITRQELLSIGDPPRELPPAIALELKPSPSPTNVPFLYENDPGAKTRDGG